MKESMQDVKVQLSSGALPFLPLCHLPKRVMWPISLEEIHKDKTKIHYLWKKTVHQSAERLQLQDTFKGKINSLEKSFLF